MTWLRPAPDEQAAVARLLLTAIVDGRDGFLEMRWKVAGVDRMRQRFYRAGDVTQLVDDAHALAQSADVYVGALLRSRHDNGGKDAVAPSRLVWADVDSTSAVDSLRGFRVPPTFVIASGSLLDDDVRSVHAWWLVKELLPADHVERANRRIAHALGSDARSTDAARILRVPGTLNHKTSPPRPVVALAVSDAPAPTIREVAGNLPDPPQDVPQRAVAPPRREYGEDPLRAIPAVEYVERLTGIVVPRSRMVSCPLPDHDDRTPSCHVGGSDDAAWWCHGCGRGGGIFDLAAALDGRPIPPRGDDFRAVRDALSDRFAISRSTR